MPDNISRSRPTLPAACYLKSAHFQIKRLDEAQEIAHFLAHACPNPRLATVGLNEIFINAIEHGNLNISFEEKTHLKEQKRWMEEIDNRINLPENINKFVSIIFERLETSLKITVIDQGQGFDWSQIPYINKAQTSDKHGRGITLAKHLIFSELRFSKSGNEVVGIIPLSPLSEG